VKKEVGRSVEKSWPTPSPKPSARLPHGKTKKETQRIWQGLGRLPQQEDGRQRRDQDPGRLWKGLGDEIDPAEATAPTFGE